uniref:Uncharacterized protein n=1 Tax=Panagrolaimus sp. ES5 TaxID=591445 RepID=A0AC34G2W6_9BILA
MEMDLNDEIDIEQTTAVPAKKPTQPIVPPTALPPDHGHGKDKKEDDGLSTGALAAIIVVVLIILVALIVIMVLIIRYFCCKKNKKNENNTESGQNGKQVKESEIFKAKPVIIQKPELAKPLAPDHIRADQFKYKGPLILQVKAPDEVPLVHELDNEKPPSIHQDQEIQWDSTMNEVYEIGSDVELMMDGDVPKPRKARSSLPSPYAAAGPKPPSGKKHKMTEKQKDKAIRE